MNHAQHWATRCVHEASLHDANSFLTLTYSDQRLPAGDSLCKREFQRFLKRCQMELSRSYGCRVRYFGCGEYGSETFRPHYHLILFGFDFSDSRRPTGQGRRGDVLYESLVLDRLWGRGRAWIGAVNHTTAGYVAQYALKKARTYKSGFKRVALDARTGELVEREPEFLLMSRRPGVGSGWWDKFASDCFPSDFVVVDGKKLPVPPYYTNKIRRAEKEEGRWDHASGLAGVMEKRRRFAEECVSDDTTERRQVRQELLERKLDVFGERKQ